VDTKELLKKVRKIEIKTRRLSDHIFSGEYHSSFKGRGMTFSEVRQYQFGDDIRSIDWNVTARYSEPYVKVFEEERELTMMLVVDISGSESFGTTQQFKKDILTEISATLAFSAIQNNDKVGLLLFSDEIELFIPPKKGKTHVLRIIRELIEFKPNSKKTDLTQALRYFSNVMKKKAIVFILSDFIDMGYDIGMVPMRDAENGEIVLVNTNSKTVRRNYKANYLKTVDYFEDSFTKSGSGVINTRVDESYVKKLLGYFKRRA